MGVGWWAGLGTQSMILWFHLSLQSRKAQRRQTQITPSAQLNPSRSSLSTSCQCPTRSSSYKILETFRGEGRNKIPSTGSRGGLVTTNRSGLKGKPKSLMFWFPLSLQFFLDVARADCELVDTFLSNADADNPPVFTLNPAPFAWSS
jgi:hypothetical protein